MKGNIMDINLRADAPDQSDVIDPKKLRAWNNTGLRARGESPIAA
jgi:hypothetical protein